MGARNELRGQSGTVSVWGTRTQPKATSIGTPHVCPGITDKNTRMAGQSTRSHAPLGEAACFSPVGRRTVRQVAASQKLLFPKVAAVELSAAGRERNNLDYGD